MANLWDEKKLIRWINKWLMTSVITALTLWITHGNPTVRTYLLSGMNHQVGLSWKAQVGRGFVHTWGRRPTMNQESDHSPETEHM
jgi:hypothetical protein